MIVTCEQCLTQSTLPDEHVAPRGVQVRCKKCGHRFRVAPELGMPEPAPESPVSLAAPAPSGSSAVVPFDFSSLVPPVESRPTAPLPFEALAPPPMAPPPVESPTPFDFSSVLSHSEPEAPPPEPWVPPVEAPPAPLSPAFSLLDIPAPSEDAPAPQSSLREHLDEVPAPTLAPPAPPERKAIERPSIVAPPPSAPRAVGRDSRGGFKKNLVAMLAFLVAAGAVGLMAVSLVRQERFQRFFSEPQEWVTHDISQGLYETKVGRSLLYVRGAVVNHSGAASRAQVTAELVSDGKVIRSQRVFAGPPPNPEELYLVEGTVGLEALLGHLESRALLIPAGGSADFVVPFVEYPADVRAFTVRVSVKGVSP